MDDMEEGHGYSWYCVTLYQTVLCLYMLRCTVLAYLQGTRWVATWMTWKRTMGSP